MFKKDIPAFTWLPNYQKQYLHGDLSAGLIVAIMLIPQSMAYALLAGLPPIAGLYAATIPLFIYAVFGSSSHLAVGPVAIVSLLVFTAISPLAEPGTEEYIYLVLLLMLMVGVLQFLLGVFHLGFVANLFPHAVLSGFTSAAAIMIGLSQLKYLIGVNLEAKSNPINILVEAFIRIDEVNIFDLLLGLTGIGVIILTKKYTLKIPGPLVVVVGSILFFLFTFFN